MRKINTQKVIQREWQSIAGKSRQRMGKSEKEQDVIYRVALLHDMGKIRIPDAIINKPGKLTEQEFSMIKLHPVTGYHILKGIRRFKWTWVLVQNIIMNIMTEQDIQAD